MRKCKTKTVQADLDLFTDILRHVQTYPDIIRHIQACSGIIQAYSEPCITLEYSEPCYIQKMLLRHVQSSGLFRTVWYSELEAYLVPCQKFTKESFEKQLTAIVIFGNYNYLGNISFLFPLVDEIEMVFLCKPNFYSRSRY